MGIKTGMNEQYSSDIFQDVREEGFAFWSGITPWPTDTKEYAFIGRVVNEIGRRFFPEKWTRNEFVELFLPKYLEESDFKFDKETYEWKYLRDVIQAVEIDHGVLLHPREAFLYFIASDRAESLQRIRAVVNVLLKALLSGDLKAFKQRIGGGVPFIEMDTVEWTRDDVYDWFAFCHNGHSPLPASWLKRNYSVEALPSFIFVTRASLNAFLEEWGSGLQWYQYCEPAAAGHQMPVLGTPASTPESELPVSSDGVDFATSEGPTQRDTEADADSDGSPVDVIPVRDSAGQSENKSNFTLAERDIHDAIQSLWPAGDFPNSRGQLQAAVNHYLKAQKLFTAVPSARTYQRYYRKLGRTPPNN